ncbi:MAG: hypothetical protein NTZ26_12325 [Candidatus Aminicenantes bacterium]|nr:hypothetical protein [Candidatus Aminicenantes bacterium]
MRTRTIACLVLAASALAGSADVSAAGQTVPGAEARAFTVSPLTGFPGLSLEVLLYNPPVAEAPWKAPDKPETTKRKIDAVLVFYGKGLPDGKYALAYAVEAGEAKLVQAEIPAEVVHGNFEAAVVLQDRYPSATQVSYRFASGARIAARGTAPLCWSRFHGRVRYVDGGWRSTYLEFHPNGFRSVGSFYVPAAEDGTFDALLPARVYSVLNVNGAGYSIDAMERWAWDYDLTRDREDDFAIGRTELYAIRAFDLNAPVATVFIMFRPSALSRVLRYDADGDGRVSAKEMAAAMEAMKNSPTVIAPELKAEDIEVRLDGRPEKIVRFDMIPEYDGGLWQAQYILQIFPEPRPERGVWHEIKLEVRSKETLRGREIVDFGQGSVGFYRY